MSYSPSLPEIAKAYQNDPRTQLAQQMMQAGSSGAPVAGGGYAWADGLARALQGIAGGFIQKKQGKKYEKDEQALTDLYAAASGGGAQGGGAQGGTAAPQAPPPQAMPQAAPQGLPQAPPQPQAPADPLAAFPDAQAAPQGLPQAPQIAAALGAPVPASLPVSTSLPVQAAAPHRTPMPDASKVAHEMGYGDYVTSGYRGPNNPLSKANPRSYHARTHQAVDVKPIPGMDFDGYVDSFKKAGYSIVEARDEVKHPSAYATGPHWHVVLGPQTATPDAAAHMAENTGQASNRQMEPLPAEPDLPAMPQRPDARPAAQSRRLAAGQTLMASHNRYAIPTAMRMIEEGMGEQFSADREALTAERGLDETAYGAGLNNAYSAQGDQRRARYSERQDARNNNFTREQTEDAQQYGTGERVAGQNFQAGENAAQRTFSAGQSALDRQATAANTQAVIQGKILTEREKQQAKQAAYLSTPQGTSMYNAVAGTIKQNDDITAQIDAFMDLNAKQGTGGMFLNEPTGIGSWVGRTTDSDIAQMNQITQKIAPLMRSAGAGSMSDKDLAGFKQSVPNINATHEANVGAANRLKLGAKRMNDFEMSRLQAAAAGNQAGFMREWAAFRERVPISSGKTFEEWKSSIPQYDANGKAK